MNLREYLNHHDGRVQSHGAELIRLAKAAGCAPSYLYLAALGHKAVSEALAKALRAASHGQALGLDAAHVNVPRPQPAAAPSPEVMA